MLGRFPEVSADGSENRPSRGLSFTLTRALRGPIDLFHRRQGFARVRRYAFSGGFFLCDTAANRCLSRMPCTHPPNQALADLAAVLGPDNVRMLVRTFLRDFPVAFKQLSGGERKDRHRIAHSMKSNSRLVGAHDLSKRMAALEQRLAEPGGEDITADDLAGISADFESIAGSLREFANQT